MGAPSSTPYTLAPSIPASLSTFWEGCGCRTSLLLPRGLLHAVQHLSPSVLKAAAPHCSVPWTDHTALQHHSEGSAHWLFFPNLGVLFKTFWGDVLPSLYIGLSHSHPNNRWHHLTARAHDPSFPATPQVHWLHHMATSYTWTAPLHVFAVKSIY